jgi:pilus assembly protein CpaB
MKKRLLTIVLALVLAGIGTSGVLAYAKQADARAITGMKAVSVLVAQKLIPSGTSAGAALRGGMLAAEKLPASSVPPSAVRSVGPALSSLVTSAAVQSGQLLLRAILVKAGTKTVPGSVTLPPGMIEVTVHLCVPEAVSGDLQAGSQVAVFDTVVLGGGGVSAGAACDGQHAQQAGTVQTRVVLPRVQVMSVGTAPVSGQPAAAAQSVSAGSGMLVTLAVSQAQAERLIQVSVTGLPYLALLGTTSRTDADSGRLLASQANPSPTPTPKPKPKPRPTPTPTPSMCLIPIATPKPSPSPAPAPTHKKSNGPLKPAPVTSRQR